MAKLKDKDWKGLWHNTTLGYNRDLSNLEFTFLALIEKHIFQHIEKTKKKQVKKMVKEYKKQLMKNVNL